MSPAFGLLLGLGVITTAAGVVAYDNDRGWAIGLMFAGGFLLSLYSRITT